MKRVNITDYGADENALNNAGAIQAAIDDCHDGGIVVIPAKTFISGAIYLRSNITLYLEKGAVLQGSDDFRDYEKYASGGWREKPSHWFDAFICATDEENIIIEGEGTIDGVDCFNPNGEEKFRGPHCIRFVRCKNARVSGINIKRSANYPLFFIQSNNIEVSGVTLRGGHDGVHAQRCNNMIITDCDFRTGDDCVAGSDNQNFVIRDCRFNSSCNGFRLGCLNLTVERCRFWGPGEFPHLSQKRDNMLCAIVHFAPPDRDTVLPSSNWQINDITVDNCETLYQYNINGGWQSGQPALIINFENVCVKNIDQPVTVVDKKPNTALSIKNSSIELRPGVTGKSVIKCDGFDSLDLENVKLSGNIGVPAVDVRNGNRVTFDNTVASGDIYTENIGNLICED
ncbi:MAG: glycosyl hydrolase family 28 protein [Oscillospiraceae bacterium]|nr:glycosyl hydrolase family 28 protein [Oscillospiraceae bacterium]